MSKAKAIIDIAKMGFPYQTLDPFLFCVYHIDHFPAGDEKMRAPRRGNGADFDWSQPYRMYHGNEYSGFPQHPHRGFETITATVDGIIDHTDSLGNAGRYGKGDLQWMTAGKGIVHGENFPFINQAPKDNFSKFFQIWLNLPKKSKMVDPTFVMIWAEDVEKVKTETSEITVWAGELGDAKGKAPPPNSWAADPANKVWVFRIVLEPKGTFEIPTVDDVDVNRRVYLYEGSGLSANDKEIPSKHYATLDAKEKVTLTNNGDEQVEVLLLQGKPIAEPVVQHGPFVMNTRAEIQQAFLDYQATQFGGWPWPQDAMIFPREKGRFALLYGKETTPPVNVDDDNDN